MALVLTRLVRSNYDELDNIPVIHQDLTASFTKQADTYYIHTGSTTSAYTKGRMYYCDGTNLKKMVVADELPAVNNGKLTITVNGTAYTFSANQAGNTSFSIQIPSQITSIDGLTGGTVNGNITLKKELVFADTTNPFIKMVTGGNTYYFQSAGGQFALGPTWDLATKWSANGSVQFPVRPKVGTADMALKSDISDTGATSVEVTGSGNAVTAASYDSGTRKLTLTKGTSFQEKLTAGSNITISGNTISAKDTTYTFTASNPTLAWNTKSKIGTIGGVEFNVTMPANPNTDTGATSVEVTGAGNAVTTASYDASTRKLTLTKGTTFLTHHQNISGKLDKTTYEWNKEFRAGSNGAISLGRYNIYDTQLTFDISSTTSASINGKLVIATQNGKICQAKVFGDATGVLVSKIVIYQSAIVNNRSWIEIFCNFDSWSKNKVHIYGVALESATVTNQMSSVTFTNGVPSPITSGDSKWSDTIDNDLSVKQNKLTAGSNITISGNTISATDTGATSVEVPSAGNALTGASYNSSTRKITFTKGTFLTEHQTLPIKSASLDSSTKTLTLTL